MPNGSPTPRALADAAAVRVTRAQQFVDAYRRYCWDVDDVDDLALAPFQVLATEGRVRALDPHPWHLEVLGRLVAAGPTVLRATRTVAVDLDDAGSVSRGHCVVGGPHGRRRRGHGGEAARRRGDSDRGLVQPGVKVRGPEYLRIIYGAEYDAPEQLVRLRQRGLGHKRSLALREFALGIEALERFVAHEPLYRVHECVFGVLALESEPVDPRL